MPWDKGDVHHWRVRARGRMRDAPGKVVFADGFGLRELGKPTRVDADTRYMIASNTKAMATLMLARLVDERKIGWESPAVSLLPSFKLGDAQTTSKVRVKGPVRRKSGGRCADRAAQAKSFFTAMAAERRLLTTPADPATAAELAPRYSHPALGEVEVIKQGTTLRFDFGEWSSEMASCKNPYGTNSVMTIVPGFSDLEFVMGRSGSRRALTLRDAQHEYVLLER